MVRATSRHERRLLAFGGINLKSNPSNLAVFDTFKTKSHELTGEAVRQRSIIVALATQTNPIEKTRTGISQKIANQNGVAWKNLYSGVFRDLDEILIPLELVKEEGRLPLKRGPKALQEKGIPYYRLTRQGLLVSLSLDEIKDRTKILEQFFSTSNKEEKEFREIMLKLAKISPTFTFSLFEKYVKAYCDGKLKNLLPLNFHSLKDVPDEGLKVIRDFLEAFFSLSKSERDETISFFKKIC